MNQLTLLVKMGGGEALESILPFNFPAGSRNVQFCHTKLNTIAKLLRRLQYDGLELITFLTVHNLKENYRRGNRKKIRIDLIGDQIQLLNHHPVKKPFRMKMGQSRNTLPQVLVSNVF